MGAPAGPAGDSAAGGAPIDAARLPRHVGIIMDGNGRWARARGLPREEGHERGADSVRTVVRAARQIGIEALTLFAFSSQNWDRPPEEVFHLMELLRRYLVQERGEILDNGIRLVTVGEPERLPSIVRTPLVELMAASAQNRDMMLCLALSYGGREMIAKAARELCRKVAAGDLDPDDVDQDTLEAHLDSARLLPPLDLLIRTSGEHRISNFFLWETAYAELHFTEKLWPEFGREDLTAALVDFAGRERRFGQTPEQVAQRATTPLAPGGNGGGSAAGMA
jgi:undecaprenyl diphosphate synthase